MFKAITTRDRSDSLVQQMVPIGNLPSYIDELVKLLDTESRANVFMFGWLIVFEDQQSHWVDRIDDEEFDQPFEAFINDDSNPTWECDLCGEDKMCSEELICKECHELGRKCRENPFYIHDVGEGYFEKVVYLSNKHEIIATFSPILECKMTSMYTDAVYMHWLITMVLQKNLLSEVINLIVMLALSGIDCAWSGRGIRYNISYQMYGLVSGCDSSHIHMTIPDMLTKYHHELACAGYGKRSW